MNTIELKQAISIIIMDAVFAADDAIAGGTLSRADAIDRACADVAGAMQYLWSGIDYAPYAALTRQRIINLISVE